jgi:hypothetical protein
MTAQGPDLWKFHFVKHTSMISTTTSHFNGGWVRIGALADFSMAMQ